MTSGIPNNVSKFINVIKSFTTPLGKQLVYKFPEGVVKFYITYYRQNYVYLTDFEAMPCNIGIGTQFLSWLTKLADKYKIDIYISPKSFNENISDKKLKDFYRKFNFKNHGSDMIRTAKTKETASNDLRVLNVKDYLSKNGSPTNYSGPKNPEDSPTGDYKIDQKVSALLDKLADLTDKAIAENKDVPDYNLCDIQVPGTNLFCNDNLGVARKDMPQLKGRAEEGSWADLNLEKDDSGEVDAENVFRKLLETKGINIVSKKLPANELKATQKELVGSKVAGMTKALQENPHDEGITAPIFVSKDNYILDGHHKWAAQVGLGIKSGIKDAITMSVEVVDMTIEDLLKLANNFCEAIGIKAKAGKAKEHSHLKILKVLSTTDKSPNFSMHTLDDLKNYFTKNNVLTLINVPSNSVFKIGDKFDVTKITNAGVWLYNKKRKQELCLENPDTMPVEYINVDNNNFTFSKGGRDLTFTKK